MHQWLVEVEDVCGQKKVLTTEKGRVFLEKWTELLSLAGIKNKRLYSTTMNNLQAARIICR